MKKAVLSIMMALIILASLSACSNGANSATQQGGSGAESRSATPNSDVSTEPMPTELLSEKYLDISTLPVLDVAIEEQYIFDDRTITLEAPVDNELERLAYEFYYYITSGEFEKLADLTGENESFQIAVNNEEVNFNKGIYMREYTIHELATLSEEDLQDANDTSKEDILTKIDTYGFDQYAVVRVDVSWKHNEAGLCGGPQLGDGRYMRYILFATTQDDPEFKMYEMYWEDFFWS